ncbi:MAG: tRNA lysidine(34) synthetase TilS [Paracoccaceae bacterium]
MSLSLDADWLAALGEDAPLLIRAQSAFARVGGTPAHIGVAVSGGSDSMAMLHLMARAASHTAWNLRAVTVDHGLRPEAAEEAAFVAQACVDLGLPHDVLVWDHGAIDGNLMQAASRARYALMADWAVGLGIAQVTLAHTADDQAETFLMGLSRAAGLDGLTGMRQHWTEAGVTFCRPFLHQTRAELRGFLTRHGLSWVDDPTNDNDRFTRVKARRALKALKPLGITVDRLSSVIHNLAMAQGALHDAVARAGAEGVTETAGSLRFGPGALGGPEVQRRLLIAMIAWIGGNPHPPRESKIAALRLAVLQERDATLGGVRIRWKEGTCTVSREARAVGGPVPAGHLWDGRWQVSAASGEISALGAAGLRQCPDWRALGLPRQVLEVTPAVWQADRLIAAPCAGVGAATATTRPGFHAFLLSH